MNRTIFQRLVTAYDAKRPVNLAEVAVHELLSVPITIFEPSGSMRSGPKSTIVCKLMSDLPYTALTMHDLATSTLIVDMMARVQSIGLPKHSTTFWELADVDILTGYCLVGAISAALM